MLINSWLMLVELLLLLLLIGINKILGTAMHLMLLPIKRLVKLLLLLVLLGRRPRCIVHQISGVIRCLLCLWLLLLVLLISCNTALLLVF